MSKKDVYVLGMGAVSPFGKGVETLWQNLLAGNCAIRPITVISTDGLRNSNAGQVDGYPPDVSRPRSLRMLIDAASEALEPLKSQPEALSKVTLVRGTNFGGVERAEEGLFEKPEEIGRFEFAYAASHLKEALGITGPHYVISLSCASGAATIHFGKSLIQKGRADYVLACGYDELSRYALVGLSALRAITADQLKPFAADRGGTIFSEGAGAILLGYEKPAGKPVIAAGSHINNDAYHLTAPEKTGIPIQNLIKAAISDACIAPENINYINAHATGTPYNDANETSIFKAVFGEKAYKIPISSNKGAIGHCMGAAGTIETIATIRAIQEEKLPPTIHSAPPDPELDLDYLRDGPRQLRVNYALKTSYGFGGTNAALVLKRAW